MNPVQVAIIAFVVIVILLTLVYYWYDDAKFKRKVENNFNHATKDVLQDEQQSLVLDGTDHVPTPKAILQKDTHVQIDPFWGDTRLADESNLSEPVSFVTPTKVVNQEVSEKNTEEVPEDSAEAFFVKLDKMDFTYAKDVDRDLDLVIDIVFEEPKKLKVLPDITQYTHKYFIFYVLNKDNQWYAFEKGGKYTATALKLVIQLVDKEGIINQAQIANIYNELHKFVIGNDAHIRCSDYELKIEHIQEKIKHLNNIELVLELYLLIKDKQPARTLSKFLTNAGFVDNQGIFVFSNKEVPLFTVSGDNKSALEAGNEYNMLAIEAKLHTHANPLEVVDKIFDFGESFMTQFESRMLSTNKQVLTQKDYDNLYSYIKNYIDSAVKKHIVLGSSLIRRIL